MAPAAFWSGIEGLDEAFDEPDLVADAELCRAIAAGRWGLHPDGWGNHHRISGPPVPARHWVDDWHWLPARWRVRHRVDPKEHAEWEAKHRRRPVEDRPWRPHTPAKPKPKPKPVPAWEPPPLPFEHFAGEIELTCDVCHRRFGLTLAYKTGERPIKAAALRALGAEWGWTHIGGRDRCRECSPPQDVGNGAGEGEGDKQHADGG